MRVFSPRGQVVGILLHVLSKMDTSVSKNLAIACIRSWKLFAFADEDERPYPSIKENGGDEPRWVTLVAFARKDCVESKPSSWMQKTEKDCWKITMEGRAVLGNLMQQCAAGIIDVRHGYLWTPQFKKILCPTYELGSGDATRPTYSIYDDTKAAFEAEKFGALLTRLRAESK